MTHTQVRVRYSMYETRRGRNDFEELSALEQSVMILWHDNKYKYIMLFSQAFQKVTNLVSFYVKKFIF